ncbi:hypothetical protein D3C80_973920 [compost metagenome]
MLDICQIEYDEKGVIGRQDNRLVDILVIAPEMGDGQFRPPQRPGHHQAGIVRSEIFGNPLAYGQCFTHMRLACSRFGSFCAVRDGY